VSASVALVWAMAENGVIGRGGALPWRLPDDLRHFKALTEGGTVLMGRKTFASLGRPLPGRRNLVLSRSPLAAAGVEHVRSVAAALAAVQATPARPLWVIGGAAVYAAALPHADRLEVTRVHAAVEGDVVFPPLDWSRWRLVWSAPHAADSRHAFAFTFERWEPAGRWPETGA